MRALLLAGVLALGGAADAQTRATANLQNKPLCVLDADEIIILDGQLATGHTALRRELRTLVQNQVRLAGIRTDCVPIDAPLLTVRATGYRVGGMTFTVVNINILQDIGRLTYVVIATWGGSSTHPTTPLADEVKRMTQDYLQQFLLDYTGR